jgi:hypothetical protein
MRRSLRARLFDGEAVLLVVRPSRVARIPRYIVTLGLYGLWRRRDESVLTDQRILLSRGVVRRDERSIALHRVQDVSVAHRAFYSYADITIDERGRSAVKRIGPITPNAARRFSRELLRRR